MKNLLSGFIIFIFILSGSFAFTACSSNNGDKFVGSWEELLKPERVATITKDTKGFTWKDSEGTYPAEIKSGKMIVSAGSLTVEVRYDAKDDTLIAEYNKTRTTYKRHKEN